MEQITLHKQEGVEVPLNCKAPKKSDALWGTLSHYFFSAIFWI
jgi:hypothetical protein